MTNKLTGQVVNFLVYVTLQILIVRNLVLFDRAFCYIYVVFLLLLPFETGRMTLLLLGFITGFAIDIFYDSLGINAAASVLMMYIRPYWLDLVTKGGDENIYNPNIRNTGFETFIAYTIPLIFIHHFALFFLEAGTLNMFFFTLTKVLLSTLLTGLVMVVFQYLFYPKQRAL